MKCLVGRFRFLGIFQFSFFHLFVFPFVSFVSLFWLFISFSSIVFFVWIICWKMLEFRDFPFLHVVIFCQFVMLSFFTILMFPAFHFFSTISVPSWNKWLGDFRIQGFFVFHFFTFPYFLFSNVISWLTLNYDLSSDEVGKKCLIWTLTVAVLAIILTAPLGAVAISVAGPRLLTKDEVVEEAPSRVWCCSISRCS